jgi:hypothetical protein
MIPYSLAENSSNVSEEYTVRIFRVESWYPLPDYMTCALEGLQQLQKCLFPNVNRNELVLDRNYVWNLCQQYKIVAIW